jgi:hypothetical protein
MQVNENFGGLSRKEVFSQRGYLINIQFRSTKEREGKKRQREKN